MVNRISQTERERAIEILTATTGPDNLRRLWDKMQMEGPIWSAQVRRGLVLYVMRTLAGAGFRWEATVYFDIGVELLEEAALRESDTAQVTHRS